MDKSDAIKRLISRQKTELKTENAPEINLKEWNENRIRAYLTASDFGEAFTAKGTINEKFLRKRLYSRLHSLELPKFTSWQMEMGKEYEPIAVAEIAKRYDKETIINGEKVKIIETFPLFNVFKMAAKVEGFGGSPDFEIYAHNVESNVLCAKYVTVKGKAYLVTDCVTAPIYVGDIKTASTSETFETYLDVTDWDSLKKFNKKYYFQLQGQLIITCAKCAIFATFCPEIKANRDLAIERLKAPEPLKKWQIEQYQKWAKLKYLHIVELERNEEVLQQIISDTKEVIAKMKELEGLLYE